MDSVHDFSGELVGIEDLGLSTAEIQLLEDALSFVPERKISYKRLDRGLSPHAKLVAKPQGLFPFLIKMGRAEDMQVEFNGDQLLRFRVPPSNLPPLVHLKISGDLGVLVYRYVTGGRIIHLVDRFDIVMQRLQVSELENIITELFDVALKKCHWLDGECELREIELPKLEVPDQSVDEADWEKVARIYEYMRSSVVGTEAPHAIVHGDLHPKNILVTRDATPVIIDFAFARTGACVYADYAKLDVHLQFQAARPLVERFENVALRLYSQDPLILPRSGEAIAAAVHRIRSVLWKNCLSTTVGLRSEQVDRGYRVFLAYYLMRFLSKSGNGARNRALALRELYSIAGRTQSL